MQSTFANYIWNVLSSGYALVIGLASLGAYVTPLARIAALKCQHRPYTEPWVRFKRLRRRTIFCGVIGLLQWLVMVIIKAKLDSGIPASSSVPKPLEIWVSALGVLCITAIATNVACLWFFAKTEAAAKDS
jgi:hypothetical protein